MNDLAQIKDWLENAQALVINTGAGMGVDSGLADYRGEEDGQWGQVEAESQATVFEVINPQALLDNPEYGWQLYAKRMKEYAETEPHTGFQILLNWVDRFNLDYFVLTSNIDGHFQKAGFDENKIRELHGSLGYLQSSRPDLSKKIWKNNLNPDQLAQDAQKGIYPRCPDSQALARPNVYMFRDDTYIDTRSKEQDHRFLDFLHKHQGDNFLVFEIGSGPHVQSIRMKTRRLKSQQDANIVRINPKDYQIKAPGIGIPKGALEALTEIDNFLKG